ncbi:MAG: nuclear transport factor 2 family protein [Pseudomonadota bacterium]|nr:nuclear transport factor 2 family protein [Pseudomonadota bacterium]
MTGQSISAAITTALLLGACASAPVAYSDGTLDGLFAAERAFARASTERGIRASFLEYFAADGVDFRPGPGPMRERTLARPAPADPLALLLDWSPQAGAVARAGDLGFTTGPYSLRNQHDASVPTSYGYFFSVWKRENGVWRVAVDAGVSTPGAPQPETSAGAGAATQRPSKPMPTANPFNRGKDALLALEREPRSLDPDPADAMPYFELLADSVRVLREDSYALIGADAARKTLAATGRRVFWTPVGAGASSSDDFGYTYGRYARVVGSSEEATGYYIHVWQRDDAGRWRIAVEVLLPPK